MTALNEDAGATGRETQDARGNERREFFRTALGAAAVAATGVAAVSVSTLASAATVTDSDTFNFALNIEYLLAQFYGVATGTPLPAALLTGAGTAGAATGGRAVTFTDLQVGQIARDIAADKAAHVAALRNAAGADVIAQPAIDIDITATGAFSTAMRAATIITGSSATFDPYASDTNFLLAAFLLEDVAATVYKGFASTVTLAASRELIAGWLGATAHHAAAIRTLLYTKGAVAGSTLRANTESISGVRDAIDGVPADDDQGVAPATVNSLIVANVTPAGADGLAYGRSANTALNIFYLNSASVSKGGFFPNGVNGATVTSTAN